MLKIVALSMLLTFSGSALATQFSLQVAAGDAHGHIQQHFVYNADGCHGDDVSPAITWSNPPKGTAGYALTVFDTDARGGWWHWVVLDIPATVHQLSEGAVLPPGAFALVNSFGHARWDGPCPPKADAPHHYVFTLYALDTPALGLPDSTSPAKARDVIEKHALGKARVTLTYGR
ncbi:MAG TPA: YbhB/YbcL family Raf kinase inhibitor-like protein [Rhodanobacteraceae bacterium]